MAATSEDTIALLRAVPRYLRPSHHPVHEASPQRALEYLASSPAALAARRYARAE